MCVRRGVLSSPSKGGGGPPSHRRRGKLLPSGDSVLLCGLRLRLQLVQVCARHAGLTTSSGCGRDILVATLRHRAKWPETGRRRPPQAGRGVPLVPIKHVGVVPVHTETLIEFIGSES